MKSFRIIAFAILIFLGNSLYAQETTEVDKMKEEVEKSKVFVSKEIIVKDKREQPGVTTILTDKDVKKSTKTDLVNVINNTIPSFYTGNNRVMGFGVSNSGAAVMSIRGIGKSGWGPTTGVPFLINGLDTTTSIMNHPIADIFTMKNIDRIEVLHGPQPVLYGSGALGGVVNIITKRQENEGYSTELSGSYGSYNTTDDYLLHQGKIGIFDYGLSYNFQRTDGHHDQTAPNGKEVDSRYLNHNGTFRFGFDLGKHWYAGMNAFLMKQEIHDPGPDGAATDTLEYFDILRMGISLNVLNNYDKFDGMMHLFYNNGHHEAERYPTNTDSYEHDDNLYGVRIIESAKLMKGNKITLGIDVRKWGGTSKNLVTDVYFVKDKYLTDASVFCLVDQRFLDAFTVSAGIRYTNDSKFGGFTAWQAGLIINPTQYYKIHSSVARGFNLPNLRQLYIKMFPAEVPNDDLDPEIFMSYDAGIELTPINDLSLDITGYHIIADNKIIKSGTGWTNTDEYTYNGIEATLKYNVIKMIGLQVGYSFIDNEYKSEKLPYVPRHKLLTGISFEGYNLYVALNGEYVNDIYHDSAGTVSLDEYFILNAKIACSFLKRYRVFINFNNITDKDYSTYYSSGYYSMPGFTVLGGISATL